MKKTVCELFAGVGGFRLGLERASSSWKTVWFSQWEPGKKNQWAHECYVKHFGDIDDYTGIDIALVNKTNIPNHNLLVAGFPCQDYSVARPLPGSTGIQGKKGVLWWQIRDVLVAKQPPFVLLENVDRLIKSPASQRGRDFGIMLACFAELGYEVEWRVINASEYGTAQRRRRVFIFAAHSSTKYCMKMKKNESEKMMSSKGFFATTFPVDKTGSVRTIGVNVNNIPRMSEVFTFTFENAGIVRDNSVITMKVFPKKEEPVPLKDILEENVPSEYYIENSQDKWAYLKGAKKINRTSKTGHEYIFSEGPISFPDKLNLPARTVLTSESSVNRSTHVIEDPQTGKLRLLTPVETERIQGFDDEWTNTGMPHKFRYFCMGNALVVPLVTRMGKRLEAIFKNE